MAFNSATFKANKARKAAWAELARARELKARVAAGAAYDWEAPRIAHFVKLARLEMRSYLHLRTPAID